MPPHTSASVSFGAFAISLIPTFHADLSPTSQKTRMFPPCELPTLSPACVWLFSLEKKKTSDVSGVVNKIILLLKAAAGAWNSWDEPGRKRLKMETRALAITSDDLTRGKHMTSPWKQTQQQLKEAVYPGWHLGVQSTAAGSQGSSKNLELLLTLHPQAESREGCPSTFCLSFILGPQPLRWCHPHLSSVKAFWEYTQRPRGDS